MNLKTGLIIAAMFGPLLAVWLWDEYQDMKHAEKDRDETRRRVHPGYTNPLLPPSIPCTDPPPPKPKRGTVAHYWCDVCETRVTVDVPDLTAADIAALDPKLRNMHIVARHELAEHTNQLLDVWS